jgi:hypothetical protein
MEVFHMHGYKNQATRMTTDVKVRKHLITGLCFYTTPHDATSQLLCHFMPTRTTKINIGITEFLYVFSPETTDILIKR